MRIRYHMLQLSDIHLLDPLMETCLFYCMGGRIRSANVGDHISMVRTVWK